MAEPKFVAGSHCANAEPAAATSVATANIRAELVDAVFLGMIFNSFGVISRVGR
ncbi:MAG: hypothetical protein KDB18_07090 [Salinibacterium sp.]|nr:hypothetical protein [Salinibacterium sp.]